MCRMWWPLTLTYIFKVIWPWLWKSCLLCNVFSSRSIIFLTWDPIVWVIMRRRGVSSERRRSSCSSYYLYQKWRLCILQPYNMQLHQEAHPNTPENTVENNIRQWCHYQEMVHSILLLESLEESSANISVLHACGGYLWAGLEAWCSYCCFYWHHMGKPGGAYCEYFGHNWRWHHPLNQTYIISLIVSLHLQTWIHPWFSADNC